MVCGLGMALSAIFNVALRLYSAKGVKVTLIVQFACAATWVPQVLVWLKSLAAVPVIVMPPAGIFSGPLPEFVRVTVMALEALFMG